ncbi:MAG: flagellar export chaperone FliS [Pseudomonadota bacterium]
MNNSAALKEYGRVNVQTGIMNASPYRLIQMLLEGALDKIAQAKGHLQRENVKEKGEAISTAVSIIGGLRESLDKSSGGQIAENLDNLYEYISKRLLEANINSDVAILNEVYELLIEIKSAWDAIENDPEVIKQMNTTQTSAA